jgi:hypothetical protein
MTWFLIDCVASFPYGWVVVDAKELDDYDE